MKDHDPMEITHRIHQNTELQGMIFNIQFHSTEDGPGIRTSIFMKGCPMRCPWCHNPEGIQFTPELIWYDVHCIGATDCLKTCPKGALNLSPEGMVINRDLCDVCGDCVRACPASALEVIGKKYTVDELVQRVLSDKVFYEKSGGGVTLSGGEASMQNRFSVALMKALKGERIHLTLDTCGGVQWETLRQLVSLADMVLLDLKHMDPDKHLQYTGVPLNWVLDNARNISKLGKPMWIRTPIIPGYNATEENVRQTARFIRDNLPTVQRYDLLAFNNTCAVKYSRLGHRWALENEDIIHETFMQKLAGAAKVEGVNCVHYSGMMKS